MHGGPQDIAREIFARFLREMPEDPYKSRILFEENTYPLCQTTSSAEAYVSSSGGNNEIHLCPNFYIQTNMKQASTLIHEFTHSIGYRFSRDDTDECIASEAESVAFIASKRKPESNAYINVLSICSPVRPALQALTDELIPQTKLDQLKGNIVFSFDVNLVEKLLTGSDVVFDSPGQEIECEGGSLSAHSELFPPFSNLKVQSLSSGAGVSLTFIDKQKNGVRIVCFTKAVLVAITTADLDSVGIHLSVTTNSNSTIKN
jgi:hypothetical protein